MPVVVGRTAGAVGGIADSGLVVRLTRSRLWIGVLGALLVGIVALNVYALSLNASSSRVASQADGLKRANSALQARMAAELSNEQVQAVAAKLGLIVPEPGAIRYVKPASANAEIAARRLANGDLTLGAVAPPVSEVPVVAPTTDPTAPVVTPDPAATDPAATDPAATPVTDPAVAPETAAPPATATAGGILAP